MPVGNLCGVPHTRQPRSRQKHYPIARIAVKAKQNLPMPTLF
jgi:hypothetical protein